MRTYVREIQGLICACTIRVMHFFGVRLDWRLVECKLGKRLPSFAITGLGNGLSSLSWEWDCPN